jgi:hypothetical protein
VTWQTTQDGDTTRAAWVSTTTDEAFYAKYPHFAEYGSHVINRSSDGQWQAQCRCGWRGSVGEWGLADLEGRTHEHDASEHDSTKRSSE